MKPAEPVVARIRRLTEIEPESGCWLWVGKTDREGYARINLIGGRAGALAHRASYETFVGPIPAGFTVDHTCFQRNCVNPEHLRILTPLANARNHRRINRVVPDNECVNGHEFTRQNTYIKSDGTRQCRACACARSRAYRLRRASRKDAA